MFKCSNVQHTLSNSVVCAFESFCRCECLRDCIRCAWQPFSLLCMHPIIMWSWTINFAMTVYIDDIICIRLTISILHKIGLQYFISIAMKTIRKFPNQISNLSIWAGEMWNLIKFYNEKKKEKNQQQQLCVCVCMH